MCSGSRDGEVFHGAVVLGREPRLVFSRISVLFHKPILGRDRREKHGKCRRSGNALFGMAEEQLIHRLLRFAQIFGDTQSAKICEICGLKKQWRRSTRAPHPRPLSRGAERWEVGFGRGEWRDGASDARQTTSPDALPQPQLPPSAFFLPHRSAASVAPVAKGGSKVARD